MADRVNRKTVRVVAVAGVLIGWGFWVWFLWMVTR